MLRPEPCADAGDSFAAGSVVIECDGDDGIWIKASFLIRRP